MSLIMFSGCKGTSFLADRQKFSAFLPLNNC